VTVPRHLCRPLGQVMVGFAGAFLVPAGVALLLRDGQGLHFVMAAAIDLLAGLLLLWLGRGSAREPRARDTFLLLGPAYGLMALTAALPFRLALHGLSLTGAYFEAMSGLTTTGATVLTDLDSLPPSLNLWRHELGWIGGFFALGIAMAAFPLPGAGRLGVFHLQPAAPIRDPQLSPQATAMVRSLWALYVALTGLCALALRLAGMDWFDATCHALSTLSLSGISTHDAGIAWFHSPLIEGVLAVFMLIGGLNFLTHLAAWRQHSLGVYRRDPEVFAILLLVLGSVVFVAIALISRGTYADRWSALRQAGFNVISMATTTGFSNGSYDHWPLTATLWLLLLSVFAASSGSAGGGIRMLRLLVLFRQTGHEIQALVHPRAVQVLKIGQRVISERNVRAVLAFVHLYAVSVIVLSLLLMLSGADLLTAVSAVLASINNTAHGLGAVGPGHGFGALSGTQTWICTFAMLLGRLELFGLLVPLTPTFWRQ
jgi:trk system potassium uptake protein TrkH